ncbi:RmlC-like cupin domain-containing protein [Aspergillus heterothallicus]
MSAEPGSAAGGLRHTTFFAPPPSHGPYVLEQDQGKKLTVASSQSAFTVLADGNATKGAYTAVQLRTGADEPLFPHYHRETHDVWYVTKGRVKVWLNNSCRVLNVGDFASAPPNTVHTISPLSNDNEFVGIVAPASWFRFFDIVGEPYAAGPLYPWSDPRPFPLEKIAAAKEANIDVVPIEGYTYPPAEPFSPGTKDRLPEDTSAYYLQADSGPLYLLNSQACAPLCLAQNTNGDFAMSVITGLGPRSRFPEFKGARPANESGVFVGGRWLVLDNVDTMFRVLNGKVKFKVLRGRGTESEGEGESREVADVLTAEESIFVPRGVPFRFLILSSFAKVLVFSGGEGIERLFIANGRKGAPRENVGEMDDKTVFDLRVDGVEARFV